MHIIQIIYILKQASLNKFEKSLRVFWIVWMQSAIKLNFLFILFFYSRSFSDQDKNFIFSYFILIILLFSPFISCHTQDSAQSAILSIAAFDDPVFFHGRFHAFVAPLDSRFKIPDATMEELSFRDQHLPVQCAKMFLNYWNTSLTGLFMFILRLLCLMCYVHFLHEKFHSL